MSTKASYDLGRPNDYSVRAIVKKVSDIVKLVFLKEFPLETPYNHVIDFISEPNKSFVSQKS